MKKTLSISKDKLRWLFYYLPEADSNGIRVHPQRQMINLGINMYYYIPMMLADGWHILTDYQGELPSYIIEKKLEPHESFWEDAFGINIEE